ncbi:hypothetical protein BJX65DRAFT_205378 [Aspergillus insuetus]
MVWRLDAPYSFRIFILAGPRTLLRLRSAATVAELADELDGVYCSQSSVHSCIAPGGHTTPTKLGICSFAPSQCGDASRENWATGLRESIRVNYLTVARTQLFLLVDRLCILPSFPSPLLLPGSTPLPRSNARVAIYDSQSLLTTSRYTRNDK